jgi:uncharacterized membrane protein
MTARRADWRLSPALVTARPRLAGSAGAGLAVGAVALLGLDMRLSTSVILGWDVFCLAFLTAAFFMVVDEAPDAIAARAATQDEGQGIILLLITIATAASLSAVAAELVEVKGAKPEIYALHAALAVGTVAVSWLVMQTILALHYAHEYYAAGDDGAPRGGLQFPGVEAPDYWDFLHFAIIIGVASQTADICIADRRLRRLSTVHSVIAFVFNTLIIALTINLVAGLF